MTLSRRTWPPPARNRPRESRHLSLLLTFSSSSFLPYCWRRLSASAAAKGDEACGRAPSHARATPPAFSGGRAPSSGASRHVREGGASGRGKEPLLGGTSCPRDSWQVRPRCAENRAYPAHRARYPCRLRPIERRRAIQFARRGPGAKGPCPDPFGVGRTREHHTAPRGGYSRPEIAPSNQHNRRTKRETPSQPARVPGPSSEMTTPKAPSRAAARVTFARQTLVVGVDVDMARRGAPRPLVRGVLLPRHACSAQSSLPEHVTASLLARNMGL